MSSFVRNIQRSIRRRHNKAGKGIGIHFNGRGSRLGQKNPKDKALVARLARERRHAEKREG